MNTSIECPSCKQQYSIDESLIGEEVECAACNNVFVAKRKPIKLELPKKDIEANSILIPTKESSSSQKTATSTQRKIRYHRNALSDIFDSLDEEEIKEEKDKKSNGASWVVSIVFLVIIIVYIAFTQAFVKILARSVYGYLIIGAIILLYFVFEKCRSIIARKRKGKKQESSSLLNRHQLINNSTSQLFSPDSFPQRKSNALNKETDNDEQKKQSIVNPLLEYDTPSKRISSMIEQQEWNKALEYCKNLLESDPSPGRQAQLWQIKVKASDFYLQKCIKKYHVSEASQLGQYRKQLLDDSDFKMALSYAIPEQAEYLNELTRHKQRGI